MLSEIFSCCNVGQVSSWPQMEVNRLAHLKACQSRWLGWPCLYIPLWPKGGGSGVESLPLQDIRRGAGKETRLPFCRLGLYRSRSDVELVPECFPMPRAWWALAGWIRTENPRGGDHPVLLHMKKDAWRGQQTACSLVASQGAELGGKHGRSHGSYACIWPLLTTAHCSQLSSKVGMGLGVPHCSFHGGAAPAESRGETPHETTGLLSTQLAQLPEGHLRIWGSRSGLIWCGMSTVKSLTQP